MTTTALPASIYLGPVSTAVRDDGFLYARFLQPFGTEEKARRKFERYVSPNGFRRRRGAGMMPEEIARNLRLRPQTVASWQHRLYRTRGGGSLVERFWDGLRQPLEDRYAQPMQPFVIGRPLVFRSLDTTRATSLEPSPANQAQNLNPCCTNAKNNRENV